MARFTFSDALVVRPAGASRERVVVEGDRFAPDAGEDGLPDLAGQLVFPGLVNAHDHLHLNSVPPLAAGRTFPNAYDWAQAFDAHFRRPDVRAALAVPEAIRLWQGGLKNLLAGVTTVAHHDPWHGVLDDPSFPTGVVRRFGWCHSLGLAPSASRARRWTRRLAAALGVGRRHAYGPPVRASFAATPPGAAWIIHLAEGIDAEAAGELRRLEQLGCLSDRAVLVHAVGLSSHDQQHVVERGAAVVWCPASNLTILGRTLQPRLLADAGRLALGTDSRLSGGRDLLDELQVAAAQAALDPAALCRIATSDGARVLALPEAGRIAPGARADFVVMRDDGRPAHAQLISRRRAELRAVFRNGKPAVADPDFAAAFDRAGVAYLPVRLDDRPKLLARAFARADAVAREPGLRLE